MSAPVRLRILAKKLKPEPGRCLLVDNGTPCTKPIASRGLCNLHRCWLEKTGRLEEFALSIKSRLRDLKPNPNPRPGRCAVFERGLPCAAPVQRRGLCNKHYGTIWRRPDLDLEAFARDEVKAVLDRKKNVVPGVCLIRERLADGKIVPCNEKTHARGVCRPHYRRLELDPELFAAITNPPRQNDTFRLKKELRPGICVAVQNNEGCTVPATGWRRLCQNHYSNFHRLGILHLTDHFRGQPPTLEKKKPEDQTPGACLLVVNGVGCRNVPKRRGLCSRCLNAIEKQGLSLDGFGRPVTTYGEKRETVERKREIVSGVCILVINGQPCRRATHARGLCRLHYKFLESRQELPRYALSEEDLRRLPVVPHWYFDKNVVIDYARQELFRDPSVIESVALVNAVIQRKVQASVSLDCVRAVYTYVGHRLAWPEDEAGHGIDPKEAERKAREYVRKLFYEPGGLWNFIPYTEEQVRVCTADRKLADFSLEDALELHLFAVSREEFNAKLFITADRQLLEAGHGVHPRKVVDEFEELIPMVAMGR